MTQRLYYDDSYLCEFAAKIVRTEETAKGFEIVLDQTAFYPTSGGQLHDLGVIANSPVEDVFEREEEIVHRLSIAVPASTLHCQVDWARRFDHMQQHTGQHVLSQAFVRTAKLNTVGFHMGTDYATVDLDSETVSTQQLHEAEKLANEVVFDNRPIGVRVVPPERVPELALRKESQRIGPLRIVEVLDFDVSACGGTHVRQTGEIGSIVIRKVERVNRKARVEFVCGKRALTAHQRDLELLHAISRQLSVGPAEAPARVEKQIQESRELRRVLLVKNRTLASLLAKELYLQAASGSGLVVVKQLFEGEEIEFLRMLIHGLLAQGPCVVLLGSAGEQASLLFALSESLQGDLRRILPECCLLIEGKGGGGRTLVQAGGKNSSRLEAALDLAEREIRKGFV